MRFARKPGESADWEGIFPIFCTKARAVSTVDWEVCRPEMISTPFCMGTGFMKWVEMTRDAAERSVGLSDGVVEAAILVMEMEEVFVARMAWEGQICASWEKIDALRVGISGTASMTKSAVERSESWVVGVRRARAAVASDWERRCLETSFSRSLSAFRVRVSRVC